MRPDLRRIWAWPIALGLVCGSGLITALLGDGWGDWWSWLGLGVPLAVAAWHWWRPRRPDA